MSTPTDTHVQTIENATEDDVRAGDYVIWRWVREVFGRTINEVLDGIAHERDRDGDWFTKDGDLLTNGDGLGVTITIRRPVPELPTEPGAVIVPADGHEYITATVGGMTYHAREAILIGRDDWHAAWRSDAGVQVYMTPEQITPAPGRWATDEHPLPLLPG